MTWIRSSRRRWTSWAGSWRKERQLFGGARLCTTSPSRLRRATSPSRRGFGSPSKVNGFARGSPTRGAVERSETERLDEEKPTRERKPLPLGEVSPQVTERASQKRQSRSVAISRPFVRAVSSPRWCLLLNILALSGAYAPALPRGEPFALLYHKHIQNGGKLR